MLQSQRQQEIYEYLQVKKSASVALLCERFYASGATIRRDLCALEHKGLIRRTHGGAVLYEGGNDELSVTIREQSAVPQKRIIGELASYFLKDSYRVFLDSSSTAGYMPVSYTHLRPAGQQGLLPVSQGDGHPPAMEQVFVHHRAAHPGLPRPRSRSSALLRAGDPGAAAGG